MGLLVAGNSPAALKTANRAYFTATAGQTTFTVSGGYSVGDVDVYLNGVRLVESDDFIATNGTTIILTSGANVGDSLAVTTYNQFLVSNSYSKTESDARYLNLNGGSVSGYIKTPNYGITTGNDTAFASLEANTNIGTQGTSIRAYGKDVATVGGDILYTSDSRGAGGRHRFGYWNGTGFTSTMSLDSSGRMTVPLQPSFHANGLNTVTNNSAVVFPTVRFNIGGHYNSSNGRFTAPVAGTYMFGWTNIGSSANDTYRWRFQVNGANVGDIHLRQDTTGTGSEYATNGMYVIPWRLNAGEYVNIYFGSDSSNLPYGSGTTTDDYPRFWGYLLG